LWPKGQRREHSVHRHRPRERSRRVWQAAERTRVAGRPAWVLAGKQAGGRTLPEVGMVKGLRSFGKPGTGVAAQSVRAAIPRATRFELPRLVELQDAAKWSPAMPSDTLRSVRPGASPTRSTVRANPPPRSRPAGMPPALAAAAGLSQTNMCARPFERKLWSRRRCPSDRADPRSHCAGRIVRIVSTQSKSRREPANPSSTGTLSCRHRRHDPGRYSDPTIRLRTRQST